MDLWKSKAFNFKGRYLSTQSDMFRDNLNRNPLNKLMRFVVNYWRLSLKHLHHSGQEEVIFKLSAQVYILDKNQKWSPLTTDVVPVCFLHNASTKSTRICAYGSLHESAENGSLPVVDSLILPSMQYRRPTETFVQWFDSQHILYGLNLTSKLCSY